MQGSQATNDLLVVIVIGNIGLSILHFNLWHIFCNCPHTIMLEQCIALRSHNTRFFLIKHSTWYTLDHI